MSAGEKPTAMPWRAATKPAAQNKAAPAPQATPKITGGPRGVPEGAGLGALTGFPFAGPGRGTGDPLRPRAAQDHGARPHALPAQHMPLRGIAPINEKDRTQAA